MVTQWVARMRTPTADPFDAVLQAAYRALCTHGDADLTMQKSVNKSVTSEAALRPCHGTKDSLLLVVLDRLFDAVTDEDANPDGDHVSKGTSSERGSRSLFCRRFSSEVKTRCTHVLTVTWR